MIKWTAKHVLSGMLLASSALWIAVGWATKHWLPWALGLSGIFMAVALFRVLREAEARDQV